MAETNKLMSLEEWAKLTPKQQGYVHYMQAEHDGSPLPKEPPYKDGTPEAAQFAEGAMAGCLEAQDSEG
jgi:hypothetical protein